MCECVRILLRAFDSVFISDMYVMDLLKGIATTFQIRFIKLNDIKSIQQAQIIWKH